MPKYGRKQIFSLGSFPEVGQKQKTEKKEEKKKDNRKKKRNNKNNGQLCIATSGGARKAVWANKQTIGDRILKVVSHIFCVIYPNATHRGWLRYSGDIHYVFKSYTL